jgi:hypothetical protein
LLFLHHILTNLSIYDELSYHTTFIKSMKKPRLRNSLVFDSKKYN